MLEELGHHPRPGATSPTWSSAARRTTAIPQPDEIEACRPYLEQQLDLIDPKVVVTLGKFAGQLLLDTKDGHHQAARASATRSATAC